MAISKEKKLIQISLKKSSYGILDNLSKKNNKTKSEVIENALLIFVANILLAQKKKQEETIKEKN